MKKLTEKKERSLGVKLFLKAERCNSPKCVMVRRPTRPGQHGQGRHNVSEYGKQLQEKQKIQFLYGLNNRQMATLFQSSKDKEKILQALEHRLDRVVFLLGFTGSPRIARQLISHGHVTVNGRKVTVPSFRVRIKDVISIRPESRSLKLFEGIQLKLKKYSPPEWLKLFPDELKGECIRRFSIGQATQLPFDVNVVGEFYSR
jgi:small subunit ribosomal protein S4